MGSTLKGNEFAPLGANSFLYERTPICMGSNNYNDIVASPEDVPIHLNYDFQSMS